LSSKNLGGDILSKVLSYLSVFVICIQTVITLSLFLSLLKIPSSFLIYKDLEVHQVVSELRLLSWLKLLTPNITL